jgi:hypothetical protein
MYNFRLRRSSKESFQVRGNKLIFHGEELLAPRPTPKLEDQPLSAVRDCIYPAYLQAVSSIRNLRTRHAVVTRGPPNMDRAVPLRAVAEG